MTETLPAIKKTLTVPLDIDETFRRFTSDLAQWWPLTTHSLSAREGKEPLGVRVNARTGGRIVEHRHDGTESTWAEFSGISIPRSLVLEWFVGRAREQATRVTVTFSEREGATQIDLLHDRFEALGPSADAALANYDEGWDLVLKECFRRACEP